MVVLFLVFIGVCVVLLKVVVIFVEEVFVDIMENLFVFCEDVVMIGNKVVDFLLVCDENLFFICFM